MHAGRALAAAVVLVGLLGGCSSTGSTASAASSAAPSTVADVPCPTDARRAPAAELLPAALTVSELLLCHVTLVDRGSQGWWLQLTQRVAVGDLSGYLQALRIPDPPPTRCGLQAQQRITVPQLAVDADGVLHRLRVPTGCTGPVPAVTAAAARLHWQPAQTRWLNRMLPAAIGLGDCSASLRQVLGRYWPLEWYDTSSPARPRYLGTVMYFRDQVCAVRAPSPTGPVAADLVIVRRITDAARASTASVALDGHPGITGPDPIGWREAPAGSMPTPGPCTRPTTHPYLVMTGDGVQGYADVGGCLKAVATDPSTGSAALLDVVEQMQTSPYEP